MKRETMVVSVDQEERAIVDRLHTERRVSRSLIMRLAILHLRETVERPTGRDEFQTLLDRYPSVGPRGNGHG